MTEYQHLLPFDLLPPLSPDDLEDAEFRGKDIAWAALVHALELRREQGEVSYSSLGTRIGRSRTQVQRWLAGPGNMTLHSLGLIAEGLDADLEIAVSLRQPTSHGANYCHPSLSAASGLVMGGTELHVLASSPPTLVRVWTSAAHLVRSPSGREVAPGLSFSGAFEA